MVRERRPRCSTGWKQRVSRPHCRPRPTRYRCCRVGVRVSRIPGSLRCCPCQIGSVRRRTSRRTTRGRKPRPTPADLADYVRHRNRNRNQPGTQTWRDRLPRRWNGRAGAGGRVGNNDPGVCAGPGFWNGSFRYGTSDRGQTGNPSTIFEANGAGFADALSAVPAAIVKHGAILLTGGSTLTPATSAYVRAHPGLHYAVGGPAASADPSAIALVGADRYATSAAVALAVFPDITGISVASGNSFPDALAAGPIAGASGAPLLLVAPTDPLPEPASAYLSTRGSAVSTVQVFGGTAAVSDTVVSEVAGALQGP